MNERILTPQLRLSVLLAIAFAVFNQVCGINAIIDYAPRIFSLSGLSESAGLLATMGVGGALVPVLLFAYIAFFALSQGAVIWVFLAEIFPDRVRARGQSIGSATHWLMATVIAFIFPGLTAAIGPAATFGFFALAMVLQLVWVRRVMPETKGVSLEELQTRLQR